VTQAGGIGASDRETLRWACREAIPCAVVLPGLPFWGRSHLVDLRESGPRPQLSIAQPTDLQTARAHQLRAGDSVRVWSVRDGQPWHLSGFISAVRIAERRSGDPVQAAVIQLPYRLLVTDRQLAVGGGRSSGRLHVEVAPLGPDGEGDPITLKERWLGPDGAPSGRGAAHLIELSRRTMCFSLPTDSPMVFLAGSRLRVGVSLPDLGLRTRLHARVDAVMEGASHRLCGLSLFGAVSGISGEEHRETLRKAAHLVG
jgi:hypothetical protein